MARSSRLGKLLPPAATLGVVAVIAILQVAIPPNAEAVPRRRGSRPPETRRYAEPPKFDRRIRDIFFPDARDVLGERASEPANQLPTDGVSSTQTTAPSQPATSDTSTADVAGAGWSGVITVAALESAVKQINQRLSYSLARPKRFMARDSFPQVRGDFTLLAVLLGVVAEFDEEVRWQDRAGAVRDAMAGANWETATNEAYVDAQRRHELLEKLLGGENLNLPAAVDIATWADVADRRLLMFRVEMMLEDPISLTLDGPRITTAERDSLVREAQLIAVAARVFQDEGYEFGDDELFLEYAQATESAATLLRRAIEAGDLPQARAALDNVRQTCEACHEDYRVSSN